MTETLVGVVAVGLRGNPLLLAALTLNVGLLWLAVAWGPLADVLGTEPLTAAEGLGCAVVSVVPALVLEAGKAVLRRRRSLPEVPAGSGPMPVPLRPGRP